MPTPTAMPTPAATPALTRNQHLSIFMLISGYSNTEIAAQIGVHPRTIRRWMKEELFAKTLATETNHAWKSARSQAQCAARRLMDNTTAAMRALQPILLSDRTDPKVLIRAVDVTLRNAPRWMDVLQQDECQPVLQRESSTDVAGDDNPSEASEENAEDIPLCETLRDEELAEIAAVGRALDGKTYPHMERPADAKDRGDDTGT